MSNSLEEIHDPLVTAVEGLVSSDQWRAMLEVSARFHSYSFNNQLLNYLQRPEAKRVADHRAWQRLQALGLDTSDYSSPTSPAGAVETQRLSPRQPSA